MAEVGASSSGEKQKEQESNDSIFNIETFLDGVLENKGKDQVNIGSQQQPSNTLMSFRLPLLRVNPTRNGESLAMIC